MARKSRRRSRRRGGKTARLSVDFGGKCKRSWPGQKSMCKPPGVCQENRCVNPAGPNYDPFYMTHSTGSAIKKGVRGVGKGTYAVLDGTVGAAMRAPGALLTGMTMGGKKRRRKKSRKRRKSRKRKKSRKKRRSSRKKRRKSGKKSRRRRRRRGGSGIQLKPYPIVPSMRFGCGAFSSSCKTARSASKKAGNNSAYCQNVTPKLQAYIAKHPCPTNPSALKGYKFRTEWQRASQAKCISDEAVCPTNYPGKGYIPPKMVANIAEAEQKMGGKFGIFTGIVRDFGGDKNKAFAWLQDKQMKEMAAYQRKTGANPQQGSGRKRRKKSRKKKRRKNRKKSRR